MSITYHDVSSQPEPQQPGQTASTTLAGELPNDQGAPIHKYKYPIFDGPAGERYLLSIAQQIAPAALWRTWFAAVSYQAPGESCYVGVGTLTNRQKRRTNGIGVGIKERKLYLDLQALEARGWLRMERVQRPFLQEDGSVVYNAVTDKNFSGFYDAAYDYDAWLKDPGYIAPEWDNKALILADADLTARLIKFECYRRVLVCEKPGRKPKDREDFYTSQLARAEQASAQEQKVKEYSKTDANTNAANRIPGTVDSSMNDDTSILSTSEKGTVCSAGTIGNGITEQSKPNRGEAPPIPINRNAARRAEEAETELGYSADELRQDTGKRGAAIVGIPADQYKKLNGGLDQVERDERRQLKETYIAEREGREARPRPEQIISTTEDYTRQYDDPELLPSDVTRALKVWYTASQVTGYADTQLTNLYIAIHGEAKAAAYKYASRKRNKRDRVNRVPYYFACVENAFSFTLEELIYMRTDEPLYIQYSVFDTVNHLRTSYGQQCDEGTTALEYREWLQDILDELEHCEKPKNRPNKATREYQE